MLRSGIFILAALSPLQTLAARTDGAPPTGRPDAVGLDLAVENGVGRPIRLIPGRQYFIDLIDLIATLEGDVDEGIDGLRTESFLSPLDWRGLGLFREEWLPADGGWMRRTTYRDAAWMTGPQSFTLERLNGQGDPAGDPIILDAGSAWEQSPFDAFAIRRPAVLQTATSCPEEGDCSGATFTQEGLFQVRNGGPDQSETFSIDEEISELRLTWSLLPSAPFTIPVSFEWSPAFDYGLHIDAVAIGLTKLDAIEPGDSITVRLTFSDGSGHALHPEGNLPTYRDFLEGRSGGLRYFDFRPGVLFFKDKNKEGVLLTALAGPEHRIRQVYSEVPLEDFFLRNQLVATRSRDGYYAEWQLIPSGDVLFGGAFGDPDLWDSPVSDTVTFHLPEDAEPGRYLFTVKARREYLGETSHAATELTLEVGDATETTDVWVGGCDSCHVGVMDMGELLHANDNTASCNICHAPLSFEPDNLLTYRVHYVHNVSHRYPAPKDDCRACHLTPLSIDRQSYLACLSCHMEYHGGAEDYGLYGRCADAVLCHPDHNFPHTEVFEYSDPPTPLNVDTRPTGSALSVPYRVTEEGPIRIRIYDVAGREVTRLLDGSQSRAGVHVAIWDGRDSRGADVPSGVYWARVETRTGTATSRLLVIR